MRCRDGWQTRGRPLANGHELIFVVWHVGARCQILCVALADRLFSVLLSGSTCCACGGIGADRRCAAGPQVPATNPVAGRDRLWAVWVWARNTWWEQPHAAARRRARPA